MPQPFRSRSDGDRLAALLNREDALIERARALPPKRREEVERELTEIRMILEQFGRFIKRPQGST